jgi:hypothetical protein
MKSRYEKVFKVFSLSAILIFFADAVLAPPLAEAAKNAADGDSEA